MLDDKSIDAVVIATPQHLHCEHFVASLQAGKHVYQEKTMAFSWRTPRKCARRAWLLPSSVVQIGHQDNSSGHNADVGAYSSQNIMGKITEIHAHMYRNTPHGQPQWTRPIPADASQ